MTVQVRSLERPASVLAVHRTHPWRWPHLLESSATSRPLGRWSLLLRASDEAPLELWPGPAHHPSSSDKFWQALQSVPPPALAESDRELAQFLPFLGGWFVYFSYELGALLNPDMPLLPSNDGLPLAFAQRCRSALLQDHWTERQWLVAEDAAEMEQAVAELAAVETFHTGSGASLQGVQLSPEPAADFLAAVEAAQAAIAAGELYQINLSRGWKACFDLLPDAAEIYQALAAANPAPFAALARLPAGSILSSSPERLLRVTGRQIEARPIGGTRPRHVDPAADERLRNELLADEKERAEHVMLVDLAHADMARVCRPGSVEVNELMVLETHAHLHHTVSNLRGELEETAGLEQILAAMFPGGSITGAPKQRCLELIAELEPQGRGAYTGSLGYLGLDGRMDLNILIRSLVLREDELLFRTGAGIVHGSRPAAELAETDTKARGLLAALGHD